MNLNSTTNGTASSTTLDIYSGTCITNPYDFAGLGQSTATINYIRHDASNYIETRSPASTDHYQWARHVWAPMYPNTPPIVRNRVKYLADGAVARAMALLHSCLNNEQRDMLRIQNKFRIVSNLGNIFEIHEGRMHNIYKLDMAGKVIENWCVLPKGELAPGDAMLAQKLWLETDEAETERCANVTLTASGRLVKLAPVQYQSGIFVPELALN